MKKVIVGHRGVGKTHFLKRHQEVFRETEHFDLDAVIEKTTKRSSQDFFTNEGEAAFRQVEQDVFSELTKLSHYVIAVGAGFDVEKIPTDAQVLWLKRVTDADGRIFLNRPRLDYDKPALDEFKSRFQLRDPRFRARATEIYQMPEGLTERSDSRALQIEKQILTKSYSVKDAYYLLTESDLVQLSQLVQNYAHIELRTDLISPDQIKKIIQDFPSHNWLVSVRTECEPSWVKSLVGRALVDCDMKWRHQMADVFSSHADQILDGISQLAKTEKFMGEKPHLKLSPLIQSFDELIQGYEWQQSDSQHRSFLPRSTNGRWIWYRQYAKYLQKLNYIKSRIEVADQPSLYQWLVLPEAKPLRWGAVLGSPVHFSKSPLEQQAYFADQKSYFTAVDLTASELAENILFLNKLGLGYAAVTSPLKEQLFKMADHATELAQQFKSANTLIIHNQRLSIENTDVAGFQKLVELLPPTASVAVWGGGGTLEMMKSVLPTADYFSSQTGEPRTHQPARAQYDVLIWAAPRLPQTKLPEMLQFGEVIDLNYAEHSMGLEFAANRKIRYTSGQVMFEAQAAGQRLFWQKMENSIERQ